MYVYIYIRRSSSSSSTTTTTTKTNNNNNNNDNNILLTDVYRQRDYRYINVIDYRSFQQRERYR